MLHPRGCRDVQAFVLQPVVPFSRSAQRAAAAAKQQVWGKLLLASIGVREELPDDRPCTLPRNGDFQALLP